MERYVLSGSEIFPHQTIGAILISKGFGHMVYCGLKACMMMKSGIPMDLVSYISR